MKAEQVAERLGKTLQNVYTLKSQYKCTYEELYNDITERQRALEECQDLCVELTGKDVAGAFKHYDNAYQFMNRLYMVREQQVNKVMYRRLVKVIKYIKENRDERF